MTARNSTPAPESGKPKLVDRLGRPMKHGMAGTPEYTAWQHMIDRCYNPNSQRYDRYGARGIRVCERWKTSFADFIADMGLRPSRGHSLDRIDNDGDYGPHNCRWATAAEQNSNRGDNVYIEHDGRRQTVTSWAAEIGMNVRTLYFRIESGMPASEALACPVANRRWRGKPGERREAIPPSPGDPKYPGVSWDKKARFWRATLKLPGRRPVYVGVFDTAPEAVAARDDMASRLSGDDAPIGPDGPDRDEIWSDVDAARAAGIPDRPPTRRDGRAE